jgi:hypothetical protein
MVFAVENMSCNFYIKVVIFTQEFLVPYLGVR